MNFLISVYSCLGMNINHEPESKVISSYDNFIQSDFIDIKKMGKKIHKQAKDYYTRSKDSKKKVTFNKNHVVDKNKKIKKSKSVETYEDLFQHVTQKIKKQDDAVYKVCNAICSYQAFLKGEYFQNPRILLHGSSGCGKTAIVSEMAKKVNIPFYSIDASSLTGAGYKGFNLTDAIKTIIIQCAVKGENENKIIIFFDEIDKLFAQTMHQDSTPGSVLSELLVFMEKGMEELGFSTDRTLLFFAGAFHQVELSKTQKMFKEFFGRITNIVEVKKLKFNDFKEILLTSQDSPLMIMKEELAKKDRTLEITPDAIDYIARYSEKKGTGSRALKFAMHELLQPYFGKYYNQEKILITLQDCEKLFDEFMHDDSDMPPRGMYL